MRLVSNKPLREAFEKSPCDAKDIAFALGYLKNNHGRQVADGQAILRALGLRTHKERNGRKYQQAISEEKALAIGDILGLDPFELGL